MDTKWRVTVSAMSFDLERFKGIDKDGNEVWQKMAYARSRADIERILASRRLSVEIASGLPRYHPDCYRALADAQSSRTGPSDATRAKIEATRRRKRAAA